ncbi:hypothetical protein RDI58_028865 [Solanum bulbocastanum]|uniref:Uncharacterized protein n=1 Tax=Solanum bulbocastanum TaxID=147425 RepID=A0AAN8SVR9_SOLBU
MSSKKTHNSQD